MTDPAPETAPRRRRPGALVLGAAGAVALLGAGALLAIPLGGWDTVALESAKVPQLELGETYHGQHYSISVEGAWVGDVTPNSWETPDEGMTFLIVRATVRNEWRETDSAVSDLLTFAALDRVDRLDRNASVRVVADGSPSSRMPPGVDIDVLLRWQVPVGSVAAGHLLVLGVVDGRPDRAILYDGTAWRNERTVVQVAVVPEPSESLEYPWDAA